MRPLTLIAAVALLACAPCSHGSEAAECADGVCTVNITAPELRLAPCQRHAVLLAYSQTSGATLVQCSQPGAGAGSLSYAFDRRRLDQPGVASSDMRFIRPGFLAEAAREGVPERFAPVPLCAPPPAATPGELLLLAKATSGKDEPPYCYRLWRLSLASDAPQLRGEDGRSVAASAAAVARWQRLVAALVPQAGPASAAGSASPAPAPQAARGRVSAERATLYLQADRGTATRQYLVAGDTVQILDATRRPEGWLKVSYVTARGVHIERWMQVADLAAASLEALPR